MVAVRPQSGQRHRNDNGPAIAEHSQLALGCFIGGTFFAC
jgi:hypothetical protein